MKKKKVSIFAAIIVAIILVGSTGMKHVKKWKKQKLYAQISEKIDDVNVIFTPIEVDDFYDLIDIEDHLLYYKKEDSTDSITESINIFDVDNQTIEVAQGMNKVLRDCIMYNGQLLYVYQDDSNVEHIVYGDQEIYKAESDHEYITINGKENIYIFDKKCDNDLENVTIYHFTGSLEEVWNKKYDSLGLLRDIEYLKNSNDQLMFYLGYEFYWEENGTIKSVNFKKDNYIASEACQVIGDYLIYEVDPKGEMSTVRLYNMNTGNDIPVQFVEYENGYGTVTDSGFTNILHCWDCLDLGNNMFLTQNHPLRKGIIDEENGLIVYSTFYALGSIENYSYTEFISGKDSTYAAYRINSDSSEEKYYLMKIDVNQNEKQQEIQLDIVDE